MHCNIQCAHCALHPAPITLSTLYFTQQGRLTYSIDVFLLTQSIDVFLLSQSLYVFLLTHSLDVFLLTHSIDVF